MGGENFGTGRGNLDRVGDLNAAMTAEFEALMQRKHGSRDAYFRESGVDKRNFYKVLSRNPQIGWLQKHLDWFGVDLGTFFDEVARRQREQ